MTTIDQLDPMYVNVNVPESYLLRRRRELAEYKVQRPDIFQLRGVMTFSDGSVYPEEGILDFADVNLRSETGMLQARFTFPNPEGGFSPENPIFTLDSSSKSASRDTSGRTRYSSPKEPFNRDRRGHLSMSSIMITKRNFGRFTPAHGMGTNG